MSEKREFTVPLMDVIPVRESKRAGEVNPLSNNPSIAYDYLTLYNQGGTVLARSTGHAKDMIITLTYRGVQFIATPGYHMSSTISIEWYSLVKFVEEK